MRSMATGRMCAAAWVLYCLYGFLQLCGAQELSCNVTRDADVVTYSISDVSHVLDVKPLHCEYSWANASNHVLANHLSKIPLVISNSINALATATCFGNMIFRRSCVSEGRDYVVNCTTSCRGDPLFHGHKAIWVTAVAVVILVLAGLVAFLCYKFKEKAPRICRCGQIGGCYTSVKQLHPKADVELGNK